jgi:hypothetical protein
MMSEHTLGPWYVLEGDCVFGADGFPVASCDGKADIQRPRDECEANAAFSALAVNSHNDLLEALQGVIESHDWPPEPHWVKARAAIAKATP